MFHALVLPPQGSQANAIPISICPVLSILTGPISAQTSNFHRPFVVGRIFRRTCRHRFVRNTLLSTCCVSLAIIRPFNRVPNSVEYYENLTHISKSMLRPSGLRRLRFKLHDSKLQISPCFCYQQEAQKPGLLLLG